MVLPMPGPWKHKNGVCCFRKGAPEHLPAALGLREVHIGLGTRYPGVAKLRCLDVAAEQQRVWLAAGPRRSPSRSPQVGLPP